MAYMGRFYRAGAGAVYDGGMARERIFAPCTPGLEPTLAAELRALGLDARPLPGGAEATGEDAAAVACVGSRVADGVLLRLWEGALGATAEGKREARRRVGGAAELVFRRERDRLVVSADAVGEPLFKRGWRQRVGAAPLRESLAAGILLASGYDGTRPFLDPMCGSGTLAIEAALVAGRRAPGLGRRFAFESFPGHEAERTARVRVRLAALARPVATAIHASDRNAGALRLAQKNAAAAGIADDVRFDRLDAADAILPERPGLCAVNPPYGIRLDEEASTSWMALAGLLPRLAGWEVAVLAPDRGYDRLLPAPDDGSLEVRNGGIRCRLLRWRPKGKGGTP
jgi:putative N6-adenine-specific DNA methylase